MQELWFLHSACCLMLINMYMKIRKDSLNSLKLYNEHKFVTVQGKYLKKI